MALTRKLLKGMGLSDEQIDSVIDAHTETVDALKTQIAQYKADAEKLPEIQKELEQAGDWKAKHDTLKKAFDDYKADTEGKAQLAAKQTAYRALLTAEKIPEKYHERIIKMTDFSGMELDGEKLKDEAEQRKAIKSDWSEFVGTAETHGAAVATPPGGNAGITKRTKEEIMAIKDAAERQKAIAENPEAFGLHFNT